VCHRGLSSASALKLWKTFNHPLMAIIPESDSRLVHKLNYWSSSNPWCSNWLILQVPQRWNPHMPLKIVIKSCQSSH
jgi:hypothetical protein